MQMTKGGGQYKQQVSMILVLDTNEDIATKAEKMVNEICFM